MRTLLVWLAAAVVWAAGMLLVASLAQAALRSLGGRAQRLAPAAIGLAPLAGLAAMAFLVTIRGRNRYGDSGWDLALASGHRNAIPIALGLSLVAAIGLACTPRLRDAGPRRASVAAILVVLALAQTVLIFVLTFDWS